MSAPRPGPSDEFLADARTKIDTSLAARAKRGQAISDGHRRKRVARRTIQLIREAVPNLDDVLGDQIRAVVIVLENADESKYLNEEL